MKTIDEYMAMNYPMEVIKDEDEGGFVISFPDLNGCVTCAETIEAALAAAEDAKRAWIEAALEEGYPVSEPTTDDQYSGQFKLRMPKSLHRSLAQHAKQDGVSMNQYCLYLLARQDAAHAG